MTFLLDANVFIDFQISDLLSEFVEASLVVDIVVADKVFDEVTNPKPDDSSKRVGQKRQMASVLKKARFSQIDVLPGTCEMTLMQALLPLNDAEKDRGEAASIAVAVTNPHLVFVTGDKNATLWALNELYGTGERVTRIPVFIRALFERAALPATAVKRVAARAASHGAIPSWWNSWLATL